MQGTNTTLVNPPTNVHDVPQLYPRVRALHLRKAELLELIGDAARRADYGDVIRLSRELTSILNRLYVPY